MPSKSYNFDKMKVFDFSNINVHADNTGSDNCYGSCNDNSCDINCDCVCDSDWDCDSFQREAEKEAEIILARRQAMERKYSKKTVKKQKASSDNLDDMSEEELLNLIQAATQALARKQKNNSR